MTRHSSQKRNAWPCRHASPYAIYNPHLITKVQLQQSSLQCSVISTKMIPSQKEHEALQLLTIFEMILRKSLREKLMTNPRVKIVDQYNT